MIDILSSLLIVAGLFFFLAGSIGLLRLPDLYSRLHALTKADNLGLGLLISRPGAAHARPAHRAQAAADLAGRARRQRHQRAPDRASCASPGDSDLERNNVC